jgi:hypothetical protein
MATLSIESMQLKDHTAAAHSAAAKMASDAT